MGARVKNRRKGLLGRGFVWLAAIALVISVGVTIVNQQVLLLDKREQLAELTLLGEELAASNDEFQRRLNVSDEREYMERVAIEDLGYAYPAEIRFYDTSRN